MTKNAFILNFLKLYNMVWMLILPLLKKNKRLSIGFKQRCTTDHLDRADIWIQAASAGESYLAVQIIKALTPDVPIRVLVTTLTVQGHDILSENLGKDTLSPNVDIAIEWFPFDKPPIMEKAVKAIQPKVMVLLETEIWPALLFFLKQSGCRVAILNARLSGNSFSWYKRTRFLWKYLEPDLVSATSERDVTRYRRLFKTSRVETMSNIKFETMDFPSNSHPVNEGLDQVFPKNMPVTILASIRRQEETQVADIIKTIIRKCPNQIIALFPRHMHRISHWQKILSRFDMPYLLRSDVKTPLSKPGIILWDTFGELKSAYNYASVVFVGGSLLPLGGQNFLEPAVLGVPTIIGPYYDDFAWVGEKLFEQRIVIKVNTGKGVAGKINTILASSFLKTEVLNKGQEYIRAKKGGSKSACQYIVDLMETGNHSAVP